MKVSIFLTYGYSLKTWDETGTLERELKIFKNLETKDIEFTFYTWGDEYDHSLFSGFSNATIIPIYSKLKFFNNKLLRIFQSFLVPFKFRKTISQTDILYQNQLMGSWVPILVRTFFKKPLYIRTGYDMLDFAIKEEKSYLKIILLRLLTSLAINFSDYFTVTNTSDYKRYKNKFNIKSKNIEIIPNWVSSSYENSIPKYENKVLTVGRLVEQKNYFKLLKDFKQEGQNLELDIVGEGHLYKELMNFSKKNNLNVSFLGKLEHEALNNLYKDYKYFVTTSMYEGNPKTLLEAMSAGCIVFASNIENHTSIIDNENNGFIYDHEKENVFKFIKNKINNKKIKDYISMNAVKTMQKNNSIKNVEEKTYTIFKFLESF